jgi:hypothetical protein
MPDQRTAIRYGMPAALSQRYEATQTAIAFERVILKELHFLHALAVGPSLRAALDALAGQGVAPEPMPATAPLSVVIAAPAAPEPVDLRAALGLR